MVALAQVLVAGIVIGSLYGLLALGIVLIYRTTGVLNFAYGIIGAVCASLMWVLMTGSHFSFWLALLVAILFALVLGVVLERFFARPVLEAPVFTRAIATLALALVLQTIAQQVWPQLTQGERFATPFDGIAARVGGVYLTLMDGVVLVVTLALMLGLRAFLTRTKYGIAMRAVSDGLPASRLVGVPVGAIFMLTWAVSAAVAAIAAIMLAAQTNLVDLQMLDPILILGFIATVVGGLDSLPGAMIGGLIVGLVESVLALVLAGHSVGPLDIGNPSIREVVLFGGFIVLLLVRPQGILGQRAMRRV